MSLKALEISGITKHYGEICALDNINISIDKGEIFGVIGPDGAPVSETMQDEEGLIYADLDLSLGVVPKQFHDIVGGYNRFDIFELTVDRSSRPPIRFAPGNTSEDSPQFDADIESEEIVSFPKNGRKK